jgi:hypothetical protein
MNKLFKATYSAVLYVEEDKAVEIARDLASGTSPFCHEEDSVKEILTEEDLPDSWETSYCPITNVEGAFGMKSIKALLDQEARVNQLRKRIIELEAELKDLLSRTEVK